MALACSHIPRGVPALNMPAPVEQKELGKFAT